MNVFNFNLYHQNIQCLKNKINQLEIELNEHNIDILCLTETWVQPCELDAIHINGYIKKSNYCRNVYNNGGISIFHKSSLNIGIDEITALTKFSRDKDIELAGIEMVVDHKKIKIVTIYRSPTGDINIFFETLEMLLDNLLKDKSLLIVCGDLNIDYLSNSVHKYRLSNLFSMYNLDVHVTEATRICLNSSTCIDYICSNFLNNNRNTICKIVPNGLSDHTCQILSFDVPNFVPNRKDKKARVLSDSNYRNFIYHVSKEIWSNVYDAQSVNDGFRAFSDNLFYYVDTCFPLSNVKETCDKKRWITQGIRISCEKLKLLSRIMMATRRPEDERSYKLYKKVYDKVVIAAKRLYNENKYNNASNKSKAAWSIINSDLGKNCMGSNRIEELRVNNKKVTNPQDIVNCANDHFVNLPNKLAENFKNRVDHLINLNKEFPTIFLDPVSENEIFNIINSLKVSNSCGIDSISSNMLKSIVQYIVVPLTFLINWSLSEGIFPDIFKIAKIIPLHKKGDKLLLNNYRPISLLSSISKILERVIYNKMLRFCNKHDILSNEQHGFRVGRSTQSAILCLLNELYENLDKNKKCFGIFMDLSKAFDLVDHALLLGKLNKYGFRGKLGEWLESYLSNRTQLVEIGSVKSERLPVSRGVPQGSILGPLLFILFINDLPNVINSCLLVMFADDNSFLNINENMNNLTTDTQNKINLFVSKFENEKLLLNCDKTVFIHFTPRLINYNESYLLKIHGKSLEQVTSTKFLGVHIDNALNWENHINLLCKKLSPVCFALYRLRNTTNRTVMLSYYYAQFYSRISYGIMFWGSSHHSERVFKLQKKAIRNIMGINMRTSCKTYFKELQLLPLACIYIMKIVVFVKSNLNNFLRNNHNHEYNTRRQNNLLTPSHCLSLYEKSPTYIGVKLYNKLPECIKQINNIKTFQKQVKKLLMESVFYTVNDFIQHSFDN